MENSMEVPQKTENRITIWPNNPTPGHELRENHNSKRYMHPNVHYSTIYNSQDMEATYMSVNRGMDKDMCGDIYSGIHAMGYYSALKRSEIVPFAEMWMNPEVVI